MPRMPFTGDYTLTCDHDCHQRRRPPSGGEDWAMPVGTPLRAPFDGEAIFHEQGTGGWTVTFTPSSPELLGLDVQLMHLSDAIELELGDSGPVTEGDITVLSGGERGHPGAGNSTGPHVHGHGNLNGRRISLTAAIAWAQARAPKPQPEEDPMKDSILIWTRHKNGNQLWAHVSGDLARFVPIFKQKTANLLGPHVAAVLEVAGGEWNGYRAAAGLPADPDVR